MEENLKEAPDNHCPECREEDRTQPSEFYATFGGPEGVRCEAGDYTGGDNDSLKDDYRGIESASEARLQ